jgi:uncharacterized protein (DUF4415 family)
MIASKKSIKSDWVDPDDAPDLSAPECQAKAVFVPAPRGRPKAVDTKLSTTIRIDRDVLLAFKKDGPGWQTRINAALRDWASRKHAPGKPSNAK